MDIKQVKQCFVLYCHAYSGEDSTSVFWKEEDAYKSMIAELETEIENMKDEGYKYETSENSISAEIHVPDSDIYYEWEIIKTDIR